MATCMLRKALFFVALTGVAVLLHGCGGGGDDSTTTTTITTTTTTSLVIPSRSKPMSSTEAAAYLNKLYTGFDESDTSSPLGVTLSMAAQDTSFFGNMYCSLFSNPVTNQKTSCFNGQADCRMSTSLISSKWMITEDDGRITSFAGRSVGFIFNQTMVESKWTKCSFIFDGASANRYNRGCGNGAPGNSCESKGSAWFNTCPSTNSVCTGESVEVTNAICAGPAGGPVPVPATHDGVTQCIFPGVALDFHGQDDYKEGKDFTREMAKQRLKHNGGKDASGPNTEKNNEVVLDEELLIPDMWQDPVAAIPAFVYSASNGVISRKNVETMRDEFCQYYYCDKNGGGKIPLVKIDDLHYHASGPFFADGAEEEKSIVVV